MVHEAPSPPTGDDGDVLHQHLWGEGEAQAISFATQIGEGAPAQVITQQEGIRLGLELRGNSRFAHPERIATNIKRLAAYAKPELLATGPNQVWSWDITKLKGPAKWSYFQLYVIIDIFSRCVVGWMLASWRSRWRLALGDW